MRSVAAAPAQSRARLRLALPVRLEQRDLGAQGEVMGQAATAAPAAQAAVQVQGAVGVLLAVPLAAEARVEEPVEVRPAVRAVMAEPSQVRPRQVARVPLAEPVEVRPAPVDWADPRPVAPRAAALARQP